MTNYAPISAIMGSYGNYGLYNAGIGSARANTAARVSTSARKAGTPGYSERQQAAIDRINAAGRPYDTAGINRSTARTYTAQDKALQTAAGDLAASADRLTNRTYSDRASLLNAVKSFADDYNNALDAAEKSSNKTVNSAVMSMRATMNSLNNPLSQYGVTVGTDGRISVDEDKFKASDFNSLKTHLNSPYGFTKSVSAQANRIGNAVSNQSTGYYGQTNSDAAYAYNALANLAAAAGYGGYGYAGYGLNGFGSLGAFGLSGLGGYGSLLNSYYSQLI